MQKKATIKSLRIFVLRLSLSILVLGVSSQVSFAQQTSKENLAKKQNTVSSTTMKQKYAAPTAPVSATFADAVKNEPSLKQTVEPATKNNNVNGNLTSRKAAMKSQSANSTKPTSIEAIDAKGSVNNSTPALTVKPKKPSNL